MMLAVADPSHSHGGASQGSASTLYLEPESQSRAHTEEEYGAEGEERADTTGVGGATQLDESWDEGEGGEGDDLYDQDDTEGENVRVLVRVRPFSDDERVLRTQACTTVGPRTVRLPGRHQSDPYSFQFDHVFDTDADQQSLYEGARCAAERVPPRVSTTNVSATRPCAGYTPSNIGYCWSRRCGASPTRSRSQRGDDILSVWLPWPFASVPLASCVAQSLVSCLSQRNLHSISRGCTPPTPFVKWRGPWWERGGTLTLSLLRRRPQVFHWPLTERDALEVILCAEVGRPVVENCLAGYNSSVFVYGQTGSGKTYTMMGPLDEAAEQHRGIIPRTLEHLMDQFKQVGLVRTRRLPYDSPRYVRPASSRGSTGLAGVFTRPAGLPHPWGAISCRKAAPLTTPRSARSLALPSAIRLGGCVTCQARTCGR